MSKLVSVIIPTYNWSEALRISVASVLAQTYGQFELLVVGDCCTDDSAEVIGAVKDVRVSWHNLPQRCRGQSGPNNYGLSVARGDLIAYLGHDDVWHPEHLRYLVEKLDESGAEMGCSALIMYGPRGSGIRACSGIFAEGRLGVVPPSSIMHEKELAVRIGGWRMPEEIAAPVDADFVARAGQTGARIVSTERLTVFKFNSAWRRDSYLTRDVEDQRAILARLRADAGRCVEEEWAGLLRAAGEKRLLECGMPETAGVEPGYYYHRNLAARGLEHPVLEEVRGTRRFLPHEQAAAMDWFAPETHPEWGSIRWSGPSPVCTWIVPVSAPPRFRVRVQLLNWLRADIGREVEMVVDGRHVAYSLNEAEIAAILESEEVERGPGAGALRVQLKVATMRNQFVLSGGANPDQRWLGVCANWLEVIPSPR